MVEIQLSSTNLIPRCSDTTSENILSTSDETVNEVQSSGSATEQKPSEPNESQSADASQKSLGTTPTQPYKEFVTSDLKLWTFTHQDIEWTARSCPVEVWQAYFADYADLDPQADWTDMEERADFLIQLWEFCAAESLSFPLTEKLNNV